MEIGNVQRVVDNEVAGALCLSKGGWEGWLQCELWRHLAIVQGVAAEREVPYPAGRERCDLVIQSPGSPAEWVEIKAFGVFREGDVDRFLDSIALDLMKLSGKPFGSIGCSLVVVPAAIGQAFAEALNSRRWVGYAQAHFRYASLYHMEI
jgi:hypothetical protein